MIDTKAELDKGLTSDEFALAFDAAAMEKPADDAQGAEGTIPDIGAAEAADKVATDKVTADKVAADKVAADKVAADKVTADKVAADKVTADKVAADKVAADKVTADKVAADKVAADKVAADKVAADKVAAEGTGTNKTTAELQEEEKQRLRDIAAQVMADQAEADRKAKELSTQAEMDKVEATRKAAEKKAAGEYTEEDKVELEALSGDFPSVSKGMAIMERVLTARLTNLVEEKVTAVLSQVQQQLAPLSSTVQTVAANSFEAAVLEKHSDALALLPDLEKWIEEQPAMLRGAYNDVLDGKSETPLADTDALYKLFKTATGKSQPTPDSEEEKKALLAAEKAEKEEKERKLKSQEGVQSRQPDSGTSVVDPDDFDGAFDKFATTAQ